MRANEYIKKYGIEVAKKAISECSYGYGIDLVDLKHLVESHELIIVWRMPESWRNEYDGDILGLEGAKMYLEMHGNYELASEELDRFKQAIADVESCQ